MPRPSILSGGAGGVDTWARELAERDGLPWYEYRADGWRRCSWQDDRRWRDDEPDMADPQTYLRRNARLIRAGTDALAMGYRVHLLAVVDDRPTPGARATRGADHCLGLGKDAGLWWTRVAVV